eukprot:gb/GECG01000535.1/.p1 GENE.gb/GECG01000535.1/~~gb/GECG01000535.1/.p1  ORF type:complete len:131 (+),score=5.37 gb/GECG01000535.1/:1-393(+)
MTPTPPVFVVVSTPPTGPCIIIIYMGGGGGGGHLHGLLALGACILFISSEPNGIKAYTTLLKTYKFRVNPLIHVVWTFIRACCMESLEVEVGVRVAYTIEYVVHLASFDPKYVLERERDVIEGALAYLSA